ncbi:hypothetical protein SERLA73DRAFT_176591 [Serpula lacrymans var. lacrymans S7.3]|uniref:Cytochrome P450 n=2 Tax=Serpula lacrymans var. lacrymans TaxID=341189 RepID=F8PN91_SERL3|nr:uncharacterized protein SERLADRAFT_459680 [Serpula lacrymans var. lacrymans S7.9]EGO03073.1 hypothetical protein SERLA73DRAFT_176591 [Serpula lacrymans var. lacrymans S7.3]EGO28838.1 hypothetical protein SERLADRAFT_459680 [Serpula lacrymans var. lacrymans S7.9]
MLLPSPAALPEAANSFFPSWYAKALPVLVISYIAFSKLFSSNNPKEPGRPPVAPSLIPWLGSALSMGLDTDSFLLKNARRFGPAFFVDVIGVRFLYVVARDPVKWALKRPKDVSIRNVEYDSLQAIFDLSEEAAATETSTAIAFKTLSRDCAKWGVQPTVMAFNSVFRRAVEEFKDKFTVEERRSGKVAGLDHIFLPLIYRAFSQSSLGMSYPGESHWKDHNDFHDAFPVLFSGLPKSWVSTGVKARKHLSSIIHKLLIDHLETPDPESDSSPIFMKILAKVLNQLPDMAMEDAAKMVNLYMFAGDNVGLAAFWIMSHAVGHAGLYKRLKDEVDGIWREYRINKPTTVDSDGNEKKTEFYDMLNDLEILDKAFPLLNSVFKEMLRFHGKQMFVRRAESDVLLPAPTDEDPDRKVLVKKGENIILYMRFTHHDENVFKDPHTFIPERFLATGGKDAGEIDESKSGFMIPFGFGTTVCPGRYLASFEIKTVVLTLIHAFDLEYVGLTGLSRFLGFQGHNMDKPICRQNLATFGTPLSMPFGDMKLRFNVREDY